MSAVPPSRAADLNYFDRRSHLCGFDLNLTYPQHGHFPTLNPVVSNAANDKRALKRDLVKSALSADAHMKRSKVTPRSLEPGSTRFQKREQWKRDLTGRANGTIDPWYGCDLYDEMIDYALNFSLPWSTSFMLVCLSERMLTWDIANQRATMRTGLMFALSDFYSTNCLTS